MKAQTDIDEKLGFYFFKKGKVGCYFEVYVLMFKIGNFKEYVTYSNMPLFLKRERQLFPARLL